MTLKLKTINVQGLTFQYIFYGENESPKTSVDGLVIPVNEKLLQQLSTMGGFYKQLLTPLFTNEVKQITILSSTTKGMTTKTGFFFDDDSENPQVSWTTEPTIICHFKKYLENKNIPYHYVNSLELLSSLENPNHKYFKILDDYYNPISASDTGLYFKGKMINYGDKIIINDLKKLIEKYENLQDNHLDKLKVNKIELTINENGPGFFGQIGEGKIYNDENTPISNLYCYYTLSNQKEKFEEFKQKYENDSLYEYVTKMNEAIKRNPNEKESIVKEYLEDYQNDMTEDNDPFLQPVTLSVLISSLEENLVSLSD